MHEPLGPPYYFGPAKYRRSIRCDDVEEDANATPEDVFNEMLSPGSCPVLVKDMAKFLDGRDLRADLRRLGPRVTHSFLIRSPRATVPSLYAASLDTSRTGWTYFDPSEVGIQSLLHLYEAVAAETGSSPVVLDVDNLLGDPAKAITAFCTATDWGPFDADSMLSWTPGPLEAWDIWDGWHDNAILSDGFRPREKKGERLDQCKKTGLGPAADKEAREVAEAVMPVLEKLYSQRLRW